MVYSILSFDTVRQVNQKTNMLLWEFISKLCILYSEKGGAEMDICENLARRLNEIRKERGLSISEFSEELEISRSGLQAILLCKANPRMDTIEHIAQKLDICPISLLSSPEETQHSLQYFQKITDQMLETIKMILPKEDD